jgi:hypothetical protein
MPLKARNRLTPLPDKNQLDRIEKKIDRLLHILGDGRKDMSTEAKRIIELKLRPQINRATVRNERAKKG